jgi:hypothetical protein
MGFSSMFKSITAGARDSLVETAAVQWIKSQTKAVREVRRFRLDRVGKTAELEVDLVGEPEPITVHIVRYEVSEEKGQCFIEIGEVRCSKEWVSILAAERVCKRRLPIPSAVRRFL